MVSNRGKRVRTRNALICRLVTCLRFEIHGEMACAATTAWGDIRLNLVNPLTQEALKMDTPTLYE